MQIDQPADPARSRQRGRISIDADLELTPGGSEDQIDLGTISEAMRRVGTERDWRKLERLADQLVDTLLAEFDAVVEVDLTVWSSQPEIRAVKIDAVGARRSKRRAGAPRHRSLTPAKPAR